MKDAFLDCLAATCHVSRAAEAIGVELTTVYGLLRRDRGFASAWSEALALGYEMLETQVVGHALSGGGRRTITDGDVGRTGGIDIDLALTLLTTHRNAMLGKPFKSGRKPLVATREETNASILKKLRVVEAGMRRAAERAGETIGEKERGQDDGRVQDGAIAEGTAVALLPAPSGETPA
ncbi:hypothetical protein [Sphingomonas sp.]|uniref:hypothetical protein n=1 Tax=Sphingomonas sp. TaxID=28214 RepID=UPI0035BC810E